MLLAMLLLLVPAAQAARGKRLGPEERYELGQKYMRRGYYAKALEQFNRVRNYHRDDPHAVLSELAIADLYFKKAEWDQARLAYEDFQRMHPRHAKADYVTYRVGFCLWRKAPSIAARDQVWTRQAVNAWSGFAVRYPDSELLPEVQERLQEGRNRLAHKEFIIGNFYFKRAAWQAAAGRLEGLLRIYPQCEDREHAMALLGQSQFQLGDVEAARRTLAKLTDEGYQARPAKALEKLLAGQ